VRVRRAEVDRSGSRRRQLQSYLDGRGVAKYKWPERIEIRDALPRTNVQKLDKKALRAEIAEILASERGAKPPLTRAPQKSDTDVSFLDMLVEERREASTPAPL